MSFLPHPHNPCASRGRSGLWLGALLCLAGCSELASLNVETEPDPNLAGYGGASGAAGKAGSAGKAGTAGAAGASVGSFETRGYFDLHFSTVQATLPTGPGEVSPPSLKTTLRIDLPEPPAKEGVWQATVTPRWGVPSTFEVTLEDGSLVLTGKTSLAEVSPGLRVSDVWQRLEFELSNKKLTGKVTASGQENLFQGQKGWSGALSGSGELIPDVTPPEGRAAVEQRVGEAQGLLPWEPLGVQLSEPLKSSEVLGRLRLRAGGVDEPVQWEPASKSADGVTGALVGYRQGWGKVSAQGTLRLENGFLDPAQNAGTGFETPLSTVVVPPPKEGLLWGDGGQVLWGGAEALNGPECEGKACLSLGPFEVASCGVPAAGAALRLNELPPEAKLKFRYRVFQSQPSVGGMGELPGPTVLSLEVARPGKPLVVSEIGTPAVDAGSGADLLPYASSWTSVLVPVPAGVGELGVALRAGGPGASRECMDAPSQKNMGTTARVLISSLSVILP
ncbi:MAG: hypothetical protein MUF64_17515 [Polyangiaceae bacterium]|nr:hypothetical protein [Polyangiaceae bacterium]